MDFGLAAAILVLGGIVLFHEFGHCLASASWSFPWALAPGFCPM